MQNIFTNIKCSEIILYNANENWYIILYNLFSRLCYIATCGPFCKDDTHIVDLEEAAMGWVLRLRSTEMHFLVNMMIDLLLS